MSQTETAYSVKTFHSISGNKIDVRYEPFHGSFSLDFGHQKGTMRTLYKADAIALANHILKVAGEEQQADQGKGSMVLVKNVYGDLDDWTDTNNFDSAVAEVEERVEKDPRGTVEVLELSIARRALIETKIITTVT